MICILETLGQGLPKAGSAEGQHQGSAVGMHPLAWGGSCGLALGSPGVPSGAAEAWRSPGKGCSLVRGELAGLEEASWMTPSSLFETRALGSSWRPCSGVLAVVQVGTHRADNLGGAGEEAGRASAGFQEC